MTNGNLYQFITVSKLSVLKMQVTSTGPCMDLTIHLTQGLKKLKEETQWLLETAGLCIYPQTWWTSRPMTLCVKFHSPWAHTHFWNIKMACRNSLVASSIPEPTVRILVNETMIPRGKPRWDRVAERSQKYLLVNIESMTFIHLSRKCLLLSIMWTNKYVYIYSFA